MAAVSKSSDTWIDRTSQQHKDLHTQFQGLATSKLGKKALKVLQDKDGWFKVAADGKVSYVIRTGETVSTRYLTDKGVDESTIRAIKELGAKHLNPSKPTSKRALAPAVVSSSSRGSSPSPTRSRRRSSKHHHSHRRERSRRRRHSRSPSTSSDYSTDRSRGHITRKYITSRDAGVAYRVGEDDGRMSVCGRLTTSYSIEHLSATIKELEAKHTVLQATFDAQLAAMKKEMTGQVETAVKEALSAARAEHEAQIDGLVTQHKAALDTAKATHEAAIGELTTRKEELEAWYSNINGDNSELKSTIARQESALNQKETELGTVKAQLRESKQTLSELEAKRAALEAEKRTLESTIAASVAKNQGANEATAAAINAAQAENVAKIAQLSTKVTDLEGKVQQGVDEITALKAEHEAAMKAASEAAAKEKDEAVTAAETPLKGRITDLGAEVQRLEGELAARPTEADLTAAKTATTKATEERDSFKAQTEAQAKEIEELKAQLEAARAATATAQAATAVAKRELATGLEEIATERERIAKQAAEFEGRLEAIRLEAAGAHEGTMAKHIAVYAEQAKYLKGVLEKYKNAGFSGNPEYVDKGYNDTEIKKRQARLPEASGLPSKTIELQKAFIEYDYLFRALEILHQSFDVAWSTEPEYIKPENIEPALAKIQQETAARIDAAHRASRR